MSIKMLPAKYVDNCVTMTQVFYKNSFLTFIVTKSIEFMEVKCQQIMNYINLKNYLNNQIVGHVEINILERMDYALVCLININKVLVVIIRKEDDFCIKKVFYDVTKINVQANTHGDSGDRSDPVVLINHGNNEELGTSFYDDEEYHNSSVKENNFDYFKSIEHKINNQKQFMSKTLETLMTKKQLQLHSLIGDQKFLPRMMRLDVNNS